MIDRKRKSKRAQSPNRQLRFEPLESRVQFAVDFLSFDAWMVEDSTKFAVSEFASDWSSQNDDAADFQWGSSFDLASSDSLLNSGVYAANSDFTDVGGIDTGAVVSPALPLVDSIHEVASFESTTEPLDVLGYSIRRSSPLSSDSAWPSSLSGTWPSVLPDTLSDTWWYDTAPLNAQDAGVAIVPAIPMSDNVWIGLTDPPSDPTFESAYVIVGQVPESGAMPEALLSRGPRFEVFFAPADSIDDRIFSTGIGGTTGLASATTHVSPATHSGTMSQDPVAVALSAAVMPPSLEQSQRASDFVGNATRTVSGIELAGFSRLDARFDTSLPMAKESIATQVRSISPSQYLPLNAIAQQLPIDVDLGTQLPVDMAAAQGGRPASRVKTHTGAVLIDSEDAISKLANTNSVKSILPAGMLAIGDELGSQAIRSAHSQLSNEHFVVQSLLICEDLREVEPASDQFADIEEEPSLASSMLPSPSLSVVVVGCLLAMTQSAMKPKKLLNSQLVAWFARYR